jgi:hypothetical protein
VDGDDLQPFVWLLQLVSQAISADPADKFLRTPFEREDLFCWNGTQFAFSDIEESHCCVQPHHTNMPDTPANTIAVVNSEDGRTTYFLCQSDEELYEEKYTGGFEVPVDLGVARLETNATYLLVNDTVSSTSSHK